MSGSPDTALDSTTTGRVVSSSTVASSSAEGTIVGAGRGREVSPGGPSARNACSASAARRYRRAGSFASKVRNHPSNPSGTAITGASGGGSAVRCCWRFSSTDVVAPNGGSPVAIDHNRHPAPYRSVHGP